MGQQESRVGNYDLGRIVLEQSDTFPWSICPGIDKDETEVTLFLHKTKSNTSANEDQLFWLENGVKHLRAIRHPHVVKFLDFYDDDELEGSGFNFCLIASIVAPLEQEIHSMTALEISNGLAGIARALQFLHEQCQLTHNNVYNQAIFVSEAGCKWQLGCFELACSFSEATKAYMNQIEMFCHKEVIPPEHKEGTSYSVDKYPHARDVYAFGVLIESLLELLTSLGNVASEFEVKLTKQLLNDDPKDRPTVALLLTDPFFSGEVTQIIDFLSNITVKSQCEKEKFFSSLASRLSEISEDVIIRLILPLLINRFVINEPVAAVNLMPHLLVPKRDTVSDSNGLLPIQHYKDHVLPHIINLFTVHEVAIRQLLLQYWPHYVHLMDRDILHEEIIPELLVGLQDDNASIVSSTFRALADLIPVIGIQAVTGHDPDHIFTENKPKFAATSPVGKVHAPLSPLFRISEIAAAHSPTRSTVDHDLVSNASREREEMKEKREERRRQREEARRQRESQGGSTGYRSPMKLAQAAVKINSHSHLNVDRDDDSEGNESTRELERKDEEQEKEEHKETEKRRQEMEQRQMLANERMKGLSEQEIEAWDEYLSAQDRRSSSDDDWETSITAPTDTHKDTTNSDLGNRRYSQKERTESLSRDKKSGETLKSIGNSQQSKTTVKQQSKQSKPKSSGRQFVDFFDVEREREQLEALSQQEETEQDLFADMQPVIAKKMSLTGQTSVEVRTNSGLSYNVMDHADDDATWGDGDWGDDMQ